MNRWWKGTLGSIKSRLINHLSESTKTKRSTITTWAEFITTQAKIKLRCSMISSNSFWAPLSIKIKKWNLKFKINWLVSKGDKSRMESITVNLTSIRNWTAREAHIYKRGLSSKKRCAISKLMNILLSPTGLSSHSTTKRTIPHPWTPMATRLWTTKESNSSASKIRIQRWRPFRIRIILVLLTTLWWGHKLTFRNRICSLNSQDPWCSIEPSHQRS